MAAAPASNTVECWFAADITTGGDMIGFQNQPTGGADNTTDRAARALYLDSGGQLSWVVQTGASTSITIRSPSSYDDGAWHHVAASVGSGGTQLYVDGYLVASDPSTTATTPAGYWRWGGASLYNRSNRPTDDYFTGALDEVAIYTSQLSSQQVAWHWAANH